MIEDMNLTLVLLPLKCDLVSKAFNSTKKLMHQHFLHFDFELEKQHDQLDPNKEMICVGT